MYKVFTNTTFHGHWPVGSAAVVVAFDAETAAKELQAILASEGLYQDIKPEDMVEIPFDTAGCYILVDGNY